MSPRARLVRRQRRGGDTKEAMMESAFGLSSQGIESPHWVVYRTANDLLAYTLTGVVLLTFKGTGRRYLREPFSFKVPIPELPDKKGLKLVHWAPFVTLNSISNDGPATDAAWAVDDFAVTDTASVLRSVPITTHLAVRDIDGFILRVGYVISLLGSLADVPRLK
jgi:hypothetical protein